MKTTCGIYLIDLHHKGFLVGHPTGNPLNIYSIPKGGIDKKDYNELSAAYRELFEETNISHNFLIPYIKDVIELPYVEYKHKKKKLKSFIVTVDYPLANSPNVNIKCNSLITKSNKPEFDFFGWVRDKNQANKYLHYTQTEFLDQIFSYIE